MKMNNGVYGFGPAVHRLARMRQSRRFDAIPRGATARLPFFIGIVYALFAVFAIVHEINAGGTTAIVSAMLVAVMPVFAIITWRRPLAFPYTLYLVLIPLENLLSLGSYGTITRLLGTLSMGVIALGLIRRGSRIPLPGTVVTLGLLLAWMITSLAWTVDPGGARPELLTMISLALIYVLVASYPGDVRDLRRSLAAVIGGGAVASLYGIWLLRHDPGILNEGRLQIGSDANAIDPNHFADALLLPLALALMATFRARTLRTRLVFSALVLVFAVGIWVTLSREAFLAVGVMVVYFFFRSPYRRQAAAMLGAAALGCAAPPQLLMRLVNAQATGGAGRVGIWRVGFKAFEHHWLIGAGFGSFTAAYNDWYLEVSQHYSGGWSRASHDVLLHYGVELGVVGLTFLLFFIRGQFTMLRVVDRSNPLYDVRTAIEGGLLALIVASFFIDLFNYKYAWIAFYLAVQLRATVLAGAGGAIEIDPADERVAYFAAPPVAASVP